MVNKNNKMEEVTASSITSTTSVPENNINIVNMNNLFGDAISDLQKEGLETFPESAIKTFNDTLIDKYCFD